MTRRFTAPGKVVLLGEYAVLDGAPALVAAVDRGVRCVVEPADALGWSVPHDDRFVAAALRAARAPAAHYAFSDARPTATTSKVGFGGSAAATVAATLAARSLANASTDPATLGARAAAVHHAVQGSGSGVDVAASAWGGVLRFRAGSAIPVDPVDPVVIWSGRSARTGPRVARYLSWDPAARAAFAARSTELVDAFPAGPIDAFRGALRLLIEMAAACDLDYRTPELDRIAALAEQHGGAAKPSGAGGGDCAVALLPDPDARRAFLTAVDRDPDLTVIPARLAAGAHEEQ